MNSHNSKTLLLSLTKTPWLQVAGIIAFAAITALTARITLLLPFTPVPITLQTLAVVLSGLVLGSRNGAWAQLTYLSLIAAGLPFDAQGLGPTTFWGPTAGYLIGFVPAAFAAGWLNIGLARGGGAILPQLWPECWLSTLSAQVGWR